MLKALTLIQPWAYAICHLGKTIENRTWPVPPWMVGKHLAIHAGKKFDEEAADMIREEFGLVVPDAVPMSGIVAVVKVAGSERAKYDGRGGLGLPERYTTRWACGPWCWLLEDVVVLRQPVQERGKQGLWNVEGATLDLVREGWAEARRRLAGGA